jgi:nucleoside-diphosphate-sugar epimerase
MSKSIFIVGINGFLGSAFATAFRNIDWQVEGSSSQSSGRAPYRFDFLNPERFTVAREFDVVLYCSYVTVHDLKADPNLRAIKILKEEVFAGRARRHVFISSLAAERGISCYAQSKRECEKLFQNELIVRPGFVVGSGGLYGRLAATINSAFVFPMIDGGHDRVVTVRFEDLLAQTVDAITNDRKGIETIAAPTATTFLEICRELRGRRRWPLFIFVPSQPFMFLFKLLAALGLSKAAYALDRLQGLKTNF